MPNVNVGSAANDGSGDPLRNAFIKLNQNDQVLSQAFADLRSAPWARLNTVSGGSGDAALFSVSPPYADLPSLLGGFFQAVWPGANTTTDPVAVINGGTYRIRGTRGETLRVGELGSSQIITLRCTAVPSGSNPGSMRLASASRGAHVGLGNVDNTADLEKPLSNPQNLAISRALSGFGWTIDLPNPRTDGWLAVTGGIVPYEGKRSTQAEGFVIPAGADGTAILFNLVAFPEAADLAGRTVRFTATYDATPGFLTGVTLTSDAFRTGRNGGSSAPRAYANRSIAQDGRRITLAVDYVVDPTDTRWAVTLQISSAAPVQPSERSVRLVGLSMEVVSDTPEQGRLAYNLKKLISSTTTPAATAAIADAGALPRIVCAADRSLYDQGFALTTPAMRVSQARPEVMIAERSWTIDPPATENVANLAFSLIYSAISTVPGARLPHQYITNPVVTRVSDGAVLAQGVHYQITPNRCYIYGLQDIASTPCRISYTGHRHRYDLISLNMASGALTLTKGTERAVDPEEWKPVVPAGNLLMWTVYVNRHGCDLLPSWRYLGGVDAQGRAAYAEWLNWSRSCLPNLTRKLRRGDPIKVAAYGSSSLAMQAVSAPSRTEWGGNRDANSSWDRIPADTVARYPSYTTADPDFAINGGTVAHTKQGLAWGFIAGLREKWGASVVYHNFAVGGTQATADGGLDPVWLNAVIADAPDVVLMGFANDLGASWQYANNRQIVETFQAAGIEVIVLGTPKLNSYGVPSAVAWQTTHDDLVRVAIDTRSAYVSNFPLEWPGRDGDGISPKNSSNGNLYNHGGPVQYKTTRDLLWALVP